MKVKIDDKVYDGEEVPIMIIVSEGEKKQIGNMPIGMNRYCIYPKNKYSGEEIMEWMERKP